MDQQIQELRSIINQTQDKAKLISDLLGFAQEIEAHELAEAESPDRHLTVET